MWCKPYTHLSWSVPIAICTLGNSFKCPTPLANASGVDHSKLLPSVHTVILTSHKWCVYTTNKYTIRYYEHYSTNTTGSQVSYGIISQTISSSSVFQKLKSHKTEGQVRNLVSVGNMLRYYTVTHELAVVFVFNITYFLIWIFSVSQRQWVSASQRNIECLFAYLVVLHLI